MLWLQSQNEVVVVRLWFDKQIEFETQKKTARNSKIVQIAQHELILSGSWTFYAFKLPTNVEETWNAREVVQMLDARVRGQNHRNVNATRIQKLKMTQI